MILITIRLEFDTRKLQKCIKYREIDHCEGQNQDLCYFIQNMRFRWPIFHQSRVQISYDGLENDLNDFYVNKA